MSKTLKIFLTILAFGIIALGGISVRAADVSNATELAFGGISVRAADVSNATEIQAILGEENSEVSGNTVKLTDNITLTASMMNFNSGTAILDLNGKTLTLAMSGNFFNISGGDLTVKDSTETTGRITHIGEGNNDIFFLDTLGKLTIENGIFDSVNSSIIGIRSEDEGNTVPTVIIKKGTFKTQETDCLWGYTGNITIHNGKFEALNSDALYFDSDDGQLNVTINDCEVISKHENIFISGGNLTIKDGKFTSSEDNNIEIDNQYNDYGTNNKIIIDGGTYSTTGSIEGEEASCVYINMWLERINPMDVIINGGTFTAEEGAWDGVTLIKGTLEINGGTFISKSQCGVQAYEGILKMNGGIFSGKWSGLWYDSIDTDVTLKGGKYESLATVSEDNYGGICIYISDNNKLTENLAAGYEFYEDATIVEHDGYYCTKSPVTIKLKTYSEKTITKAEGSSTITIKGTFSGNPELVITKTEKGNEGYNSLIKLVNEDKEIIGVYEVSVTGGDYKGELELTFTVGKQYEGDIITIYHKKANGEVETKTATVKDGKAVITVDELSPFMLVIDKEIVEEKDVTPKTGTYQFTGISILIIGLSVLGITKIKKRK